MARRKKSSIVPLLLICTAPLLILAIATFFIYKAYVKNKSVLEEKIKELPVFSIEEAGQRVADKFKINYPPQESPKSFEELKANIKDIVKKKVNEKFPPKKFSSDIMSLMKKYRMAKKGETITFQTKKSNETISGKFKGTEMEGKMGYFIILDANQKFSLRDIYPAYHYYFTKTASKVTTDEKISEFKKEHKASRNEYKDGVAEETNKELFTSNNYIQNDDKQWVPQSDFMEKMIEVEEKRFKRKRKKAIKKLIDKYKFLWLFPVAVDQKALSGETDGESEESEESEESQETGNESTENENESNESESSETAPEQE